MIMWPDLDSFYSAGHYYSTHVIARKMLELQYYVNVKFIRNFHGGNYPHGNLYYWFMFSVEIKTTV